MSFFPLDSAGYAEMESFYGGFVWVRSQNCSLFSNTYGFVGLRNPFVFFALFSASAFHRTKTQQKERFWGALFLLGL